ncbi:MAG: RES domain-containing protein [Pseudomonadota bacterium]
MIEAWRLVKARHADNAFDGQGARRFGGRWNAAGTACVYLADSLPLAALELFIHLGAEGFAISFVSFRVLIPPEAVEALDVAGLPGDWRANPPGPQVQALGSQWLRAGRSAALKVPSALMPLGAGFNYLLNPAHADHARLGVQDPLPFHFDPRMWK